MSGTLASSAPSAALDAELITLLDLQRSAAPEEDEEPFDEDLDEDDEFEDGDDDDDDDQNRHHRSQFRGRTEHGEHLSVQR